jgi:hypothetical protein
MISIGTVVLSDHLLLPGTKNMPLRAGSTRMTLGGRPVHQSIALAAGQELSLQDPGDGVGLFSGAQIDAINLYRGSAEIVDFIHHIGSWRVIVKTVEVEQIDGYADPIASDMYYGTITMIIME